ncbi:hypothetical protein QN277_018373 [Acacia crassicarpa]|uniref:Reverse transcriptase Ty1/copia-type domain-containing protein n=1 Tax=Acacia crassicarpa TaxID=499986 RepID=A0AAE1MUL3_9FABA|nr:hypothetical protein QN277_018373 [Acacia crassicarpa]
MEQPPGFTKCDANGNAFVCKLNKALYGLKQAPRAWFAKLSTYLHTLGFYASKANPCLFINKTEDHITYLLVYVDDLVITGSNEGLLQGFIQQMSTAFSLKDLGELSFFLGIEFHRSSNGIHLTQKKYIHNFLSKTQMVEAHAYASPMAANVKLFANDSKLFSDPKMYRSIVGSLQYLCYTRPDIAFTVNKLSQFLHEPTIKQWECVKRLLRDLNGTSCHGLLIKPVQEFSIQTYSDSD